MGTKGYGGGSTDQAALIEVIKAEAEGRGWSQSELSRRSGIGQSTLSRYFADLRAIPMKDVAEIARAFGWKPSELVARAGKR